MIVPYMQVVVRLSACRQAGTCQRTGNSRDGLNIHHLQKKKRGPKAPFLGFRCLRALRTVDTTWVRPAEAVTLTGFVTHVTSVKVAFKGGFDW